MAVIRVKGTMNVVEAARIRIRNVFANGVKVYLSLSGGKDSICMADLVYQLIRSGELDAKQLTCIFIDEEAIYRRLFIQTDSLATRKHYKKMHDALIAGDPKLRTLRAVYQDVFGDYANYAKRFRRGGEHDG